MEPAPIFVIPEPPTEYGLTLGPDELLIPSVLIAAVLLYFTWRNGQQIWDFVQNVDRRAKRRAKEGNTYS